MSIGFGIIGAGWIGDRYVAALEATPGIDLIGAAGNPSAAGQERLRTKCAQWGCQPYASLDALLDDDRIEAVGVFSPTSLHYEQTMRCLDAGKHVLVEKPVSLDVEEITRLAQAAAERNRVVFPGHNFVYRPVIRKAKEIIDSGVLGTISYGSFRSMHFIPPEHAAGWRKDFSFSGGGAMIDSGTHLVYQSLFLLGVPAEFHAFSSQMHYTQMDGEDTCVITAQYPDGAIATIAQVWSAADGTAGEIRIAGDKGVLLVADKLYLNGEPLESDSGYDQSFQHTVSAFLDSVRGTSEPLSTLADAATTLEIIQQAYATSPMRKNGSRTDAAGKESISQ
jgi:predicted dehydrogenase